jgi:hypothetical protein
VAESDDQGKSIPGPLPSPPSRAEQALLAVRRSVEAVQELLDTSLRQSATIDSLSNDLTSARARIAVLEQETGRLRSMIDQPVHPSAEEIDALIEEQNTLAHLYVASDRLARAPTVDTTLEVAVEILHNLAGVHSYAIWLSTPAGPRLVAPREGRYRTVLHPDLRDQTFESGLPSRAVGAVAGSVPAAYPLMLGGKAVGALVISELVTQVGPRLGHLQEDLLRFLGDRLAGAMLDTALRAAAGGSTSAWATATAALPDLSLR